MALEINHELNKNIIRESLDAIKDQSLQEDFRDELEIELRQIQLEIDQIIAENSTLENFLPEKQEK